MNRKVARIAAAAAIVASVASWTPGAAEAAQLTTGPRDHVSMPYITDANQTARGYAVRVDVCGDRAQIKVYGKGAKAKRIGRNAWKVDIRRGIVYTVSARPASGGAWKSIGYAIY